MDKKRQRTFYISGKTHGRFKKIVGEQNRDMSIIVEEIIARWSDEHSADSRGERVQMDQAVSLLAKAVCEQLSQKREWAEEALIGAGMGLPGATVFDRRIGHFSAEKQELGSRLAHWVLRRAIDFINHGRKVFLVCDSGTTVFWFLKAFGEAISEYFKNNSGAIIHLRALTIVTNNIPGAESFVTYASHHEIPVESKMTLISQLLKCRLLAGTLLPEYVAVTGNDTNLDLANVCAQARNLQSERKRSSDRAVRDLELGERPVFIGLTTGNWIALEPFEGTPLPHLLARGEGHGEFKKELLKVCDEIFVLAPLGKILMKPVKTLNEMLGFSDPGTDANPLKKSYVQVQIPAGKSKVIKLVSTVRLKQSVLLVHSARVCEEIGDYDRLDAPGQGPIPKNLPIEEVRHLFFPFDQFSDAMTETQLEIELPHPLTREDSFKREFYSIRSQQLIETSRMPR